MRYRLRPIGGAARGERGAALVLALTVLLGVAILALSLLSLGTLEPQIGSNHVAMLRARYLAEAGVEQALDLLTSNAGSWNTYLAASCTEAVLFAPSPLPGLTTAYGTFAARIRNDCTPGDERMTRVPVDTSASDSNGTVIVIAVGTVAETRHTLTAVVHAPPGVPGQTVPITSVTSYNWSDQ
jgi:Tfp pilus assembly protein PilX